MITGGNWWRANEIIMRHLTRHTDARYRSRDNTYQTVPRLLDTDALDQSHGEMPPEACLWRARVAP
jgi:hypothetical protein